ncbi:unnamed protein product [Calicophoron daubneyi]|uniref:Uncharacterized protein n=1 Tax=Calicophoron daubneyi TaxID=300641 RepID=A0AAV2T0M1_CALDB
MDASPTHSNPVNEKNLDYTLTVQSIWAFLTLIADYYPSISEAISSAKMALSSIETAIRYTNEKEWRIGTDSSEFRNGGIGKKATEEFVQTLVKSNQRFYEIQQNLCARAVNLREHLKARLPNLDAAKIQMLDDNLKFTRPRMDILSTWHTTQLSQHCYDRNTDKIQEIAIDFTLHMIQLNKESVAKLYCLEKYLADMLYSLPLKEGAQVNAGRSFPGSPLY